MGLNLSIKDVPEALAQRLRERAARNHRSLQGELMAIIEKAAADAPPAASARQPDRPQGWKTVEQLMQERLAIGPTPQRPQAGVPLAVDIVRADRDSR